MEGSFPTTSWTLIRKVQDADDQQRRQLLDDLLRKYWRAVYCYVRAHNRGGPSDAEDLTQQFFAMLLSRGDLDRLSSERGSFRGFLHAALRHFLANAGRAARARPALFPYAEVESEWRADPAPSPDEAFDRRWAIDVLNVALERLEADLVGEGRRQQWEVFTTYGMERAAGANVTYGTLAERFGISEDDVRNRLRETRIKLRSVLKHVLREYLGPHEDIEREMNFVLRR